MGQVAARTPKRVVCRTRAVNPTVRLAAPATENGARARILRLAWALLVLAPAPALARVLARVLGLACPHGHHLRW